MQKSNRSSRDSTKAFWPPSKRLVTSASRESFRSSRKRRTRGHRPNVALDALMLTDRGSAIDRLVPAVGIEPTTNGLQSRQKAS